MKLISDRREFAMSSVSEMVFEESNKLTISEKYNIDPNSKLSIEDQVMSNILGSSKITYEEYLELVQFSIQIGEFLHKIEEGFNQGKITNESLDSYYKTAKQSYQIAFRIGLIHSIHPNWMAKHFPQFVKDEKK